MGDDKEHQPTFPPDEAARSVETPRPSRPPPDAPGFRYATLGVIGKGAMGEVRRVLDLDLNRVVALKVLRRSLDDDPRVRDRFVSEAQITAQLEHPGVVPVHELGILPDRRFFFTMKEVKGETLRTAIEELHHPVARTATGAWTLARLIDAFRRVCETLAYAHSRGVVHRDLKPDNVMIGEYGEVLVLDWGLSKARNAAFDDQEPVVSTRTFASPLQTLPGTVAGAPNYMPPEQAAGRFDEVGPTADVYSLGAILYEVLLGIPPYDEADAEATLAKVLAGPPDKPLPSTWAWGTMSRIDLASSPGPAVPVELVRICRKAMQRDPADRYPDARPMAAELTAWLDGSRRRGQAKEKVAEADAVYPDITRLRGLASDLQSEARTLLRQIPQHASVEEKRPAWELESQSADAERDASVKETLYLELLQAALGLAPDFEEAHQRLASWYRRRHEQAERQGVAALAGRYEALLRAHDTGVHTDYLDGRGRLVLLTDPPESMVEIAPVLTRARQMVRGVPTSLGKTPIVSVQVPHGSSMLRIFAPGRAEATYPVHLRRLEHWDGIRPGGIGPQPIPLPAEGALGPDECYVAPGRFLAGESDRSGGGHAVWVDGFVIARHPVTFAQYLEFLDDLAKTGGDEAAEYRAPTTGEGDQEEILVERGEDGHYRLRGALRAARPDWPATLVSWEDAMAYAVWLSVRTDKSWRLPTELEWEKAARGVDGRIYPWGDAFDPAFCNMAQSHAGGGRPVSVGEFPLDRSPYGVQGMAGNVAEFCLDIYEQALRVDARGLALPADPLDDTPSPRVERGGSWMANERACRVAVRRPVSPDRRSPGRGFRLARSWPD